MKKRIKKEKEKHPFFGMHQVPHNYVNHSFSPLNFNPFTWDNPRTLMGWIIPSGLMT